MSEETQNPTNMHARSDGSTVDEESLLRQFFISGSKETRTTFYPVIAGLIAVIAALLFVSSPYLKQFLYILFMYIALCSLWNFFTGYSGYILFGVTIFFGLGAYATAAVMKATSLPWPVGILGAAIVCLVLSIVSGYILLRISGIYFGIGTLLILEGIQEGIFVEGNRTGFLGGSSGITITPVGSTVIFLGFGFMALLSIVLTYEMATSKFGLRLMAVREDEEALASLGVNPLRYKLAAFVLISILMSVLGGLYALSLGAVYPETPFTLKIIITVILGAILGGRGTIWGPTLGILILIPLEEVLWLNYPNIFLILYGVCLMAVILFIPDGIVNRLKDLNVLPDTRAI